MELNESGEFITGRCKYEGDEPWNGVLAGSILGNAISMAMSGLQDKLLVATEITGTISNEDLQGSYVSYDNDGKMTKGEFTGTRINPDVSEFTPAEIKSAPAPAVIQQTETVQPSNPISERQSASTIEQKNQLTVGRQTLSTIGQQNQTGTRNYQDINELAKRINPTILPWTYQL